MLEHKCLLISCVTPKYKFDWFLSKTISIHQFPPGKLHHLPLLSQSFFPLFSPFRWSSAAIFRKVVFENIYFSVVYTVNYAKVSSGLSLLVISVNVYVFFLFNMFCKKGLDNTNIFLCASTRVTSVKSLSKGLKGTDISLLYFSYSSRWVYIYIY